MNRKRTSRSIFIATFLFPAVAIYAVFVVFPLFQALGFSFFRWKGISAKRTFVGWENYQELFRDNVFWRTLTNGGWILIVSGIVIFTAGMLVAHGAKNESKSAKLLRSIYLFPQVISGVVVAILWSFLLNPTYGLLTGTLKALGLGAWTRTWLSDSHTALPSVIAAFVWYALGFYIMLFSAGLETIPGEVNEAAALDGSVGLHRFWKVTWPMLWSIKRVATTYLVINVMNIFAIVFLMTAGGPDRGTEVMLTYLYEQAFKNFRFGYATSLAIANFVVAMALSLVVMLLMRRDPQEPKPSK